MVSFVNKKTENKIFQLPFFARNHVSLHGTWAKRYFVVSLASERKGWKAFISKSGNDAKHDITVFQLQLIKTVILLTVALDSHANNC